jgi:hypothetical protein
MLAAVLVAFGLMQLLQIQTVQMDQLSRNVCAALGWCVGLIVYPRADELLTCTPHQPATLQ